MGWNSSQTIGLSPRFVTKCVTEGYRTVWYVEVNGRCEAYSTEVLARQSAAWYAQHGQVATVGSKQEPIISSYEI